MKKLLKLFQEIQKKHLVQYLIFMLQLFQQEFMRRNHKVAEAAKVIENTQRDLNIALVNELSVILINWILVQDVFKGSNTKWNF